MRVKTLIGLQRFEVQFFIIEKFTKIDLALNTVGENHSKLEQRVFMMFRTIWQRDFFGVKSPMGTPVHWKTFTRFFFFQLRPRAHRVIQIKICFSTTKDIAVWFFINNGIFLSQNSYRYKMHLYSFLSDKRCQKFVIHEVVTDLNTSNTGWS